MKRVSLLVALIAVVATSTFAQGFYVQPGVSYHIGTTKDVLGQKTTNFGEVNNDGEGTAVNSNIYGSYGGGFSTDLELGYFFNKHVAANLGLSYVMGSKVTTDDVMRKDESQRDYSTAKNTRLTLSPGVTIDAGFEKLSPYARFGLLIPATGKTEGVRESSDPLLTSPAFSSFYPDETAESFRAESVAKGEFTVGFTSTVGVKYNVSDNIAIFGGLTYNALRIKRNTYEVTSATVTKTDGTNEDVLPVLALGGSWGYIEYQDEVTEAEIVAAQEAGAEAYAQNPAAEHPNPAIQLFRPQTYYGTKDYPAIETRPDGNFNSLSFSIGASIRFGSSAE